MMNNLNSVSTFLYARPSFSEGIARIVDYNNNLSEYNYSETGEDADYWALLADWQLVGFDIMDAMKTFEMENSIEISKQL